MIKLYPFVLLYVRATRKAHPFNSHTSLTLAGFQHTVNSAVVSDCL